MVLLECKAEKWNSQLEHGQPMEQKKKNNACVTRMWVAVNHNNSVTSGE